jgi:hypothetical protein
MAMTPAEEARYALNFGVARSDLKPEVQAEYDRLAPAHMQAQQERYEASRRAQAEMTRRLIETQWFPDLGLAVCHGDVYRHGTDRNGRFSPPQAYRERKGAEMHRLGPVAGAHAEVVTGKAGSRRSGGEKALDAAAATVLLGGSPLGLLAGLGRAGTGLAMVIFADASFGPQKLLTDRQQLTRALAEAARFNALADSAAPPAQPDPPPVRDGVASELERLAALHSSGALDDEEFRRAKSRIIGC